MQFSVRHYLEALHKLLQVACAISKSSKLFRTASACDAVAVWCQWQASHEREVQGIQQVGDGTSESLSSRATQQATQTERRLIAELIEDYGAGPETLRDAELEWSHICLSFAQIFWIFCPFWIRSKVWWALSLWISKTRNVLCECKDPKERSRMQHIFLLKWQTKDN